MGKMRTPVESLLESCRKGDEQKLDFPSAKQKLDVSFTTFATLELQHQMETPWQITALHISNNNGIIPSCYF
jgi:hypothetical protein